MSSRALKLQVILNALDKVTGPLKQITQGSGEAAKALRENQAELKRLQAAQGNLKSYQQMRAQATQTNSALLENQRRLAAVSQEISRSTSPTKALLAERDKLTRQTATLTTRYQQERGRMMELARELKSTDTGTGSLSSRKQQLADRINKATEAVSKHKNALSQLGEMQKRSAALNDQHAKSMRKVAMMGGLGAGGIEVGRRTFSQASRMLAPGVTFGEQMSELRAVSRMDADDDRFLKLRQQARDLGASTAFTAADAAAGQTFLARAGFSPEAIHASMQDMLNLALANKMDLGRAADIASNISSAFKIDPEAAGSMQRVGDVLSGVAARTNVNLEMLGETMKYLGGAEDLNISLEQAAAMAGLMGNIGIQGSQAGTAMRAMMNRLTAPEKSGIKAMEAIGLKVADSNGQMRDMPDILADIAKATEHMGNVQRKQIMKDIFGTEAGSGMTELVSAMASGDLLPLLNELQNGVTGENAKMANIMADNIGGDLKGLVSAWQEVGIAMTDANGGPIRELIQSITGAVRWIGEWVKENPKLAGTLGKIVGIIAVVATVFGTLAVTAATILGPLSLLRFAFGHLLLNGPMLIGMFKGIGTAVLGLGKLLMANPIFIAIAMLAGAAYMIYRNWDDMVSGFKLLLEGFGAWWADKTAILAQDWEYLTGWLSTKWDALWDGITEAAGGIWESITTAFSGAAHCGGCSPVDGLVPAKYFLPNLPACT
jgi:TP901 family phage tail tape measure protein